MQTQIAGGGLLKMSRYVMANLTFRIRRGTDLDHFKIVEFEDLSPAAQRATIVTPHKVLV